MPRHYHYQPSRELHVVVLGAGSSTSSLHAILFRFILPLSSHAIMSDSLVSLQVA
jgi:hypothetical protein